MNSLASTEPYDGDYSEAEDLIKALGIDNGDKLYQLRDLLTIYGHYLSGDTSLSLLPFRVKANVFLDPQ